MTTIHDEEFSTVMIQDNNGQDRIGIRVDTARGHSVHLAWQEGDPDDAGYSNDQCEYVEGQCYLWEVYMLDPRGKSGMYF